MDPQTAKSTLSSSLSIAEQVKKLGEGIDLLSKELQKQVLERHGDLLRQAGHVTKLENVLNTMQGHVHNLFANAERLRGQVCLKIKSVHSLTLCGHYSRSMVHMMY